MNKTLCALRCFLCALHCFLSFLFHNNNKFILKVNWLTTQSNQEAAGNITYLNSSCIELAQINSSLCVSERTTPGKVSGCVLCHRVTMIQTLHSSLVC